MRDRAKAGFLALAVSLVLLWPARASCEDVKAPERFASPTAVFDAYREARTKREWRKIFALLTPETLNYATYESFFSCTMMGTARTGDIVPKYVELATLEDDFEKAYKEKHGIDLDKARAEHEKDPKSAPPPDHMPVWFDVVVAHVKDKVGFCEAVARLSDKNAVSPLGELEQLDVRGDTAMARAKLTHIPGPGESPPPFGKEKTDRAYKFRRVDGGWLLNSL